MKFNTQKGFTPLEMRTPHNHNNRCENTKVGQLCGKRRRTRFLTGFTLIELLVVVAIIGLLSTIAGVALNSAREKARDTKRKADLRQLDTAVQLWIANNPAAGLPAGQAGWCGRINGAYTGFKDAIVGGGFMAALPKDPRYGDARGDYYYYNIDNQGEYALFAKLENSSDGSYHNYTINTTACNPNELPTSAPHFHYLIGTCKTFCSQS